MPQGYNTSAGHLQGGVFFQDGAPLGVPLITVGTETANTINVQIQLRAASGASIATVSSVPAYLSDNANGNGVILNAPTGGVAINGGIGVLNPLIANKSFIFITNASGLVSFDIVETGAKVLYLVVFSPVGTPTIRQITFAA